MFEKMVESTGSVPRSAARRTLLAASSVAVTAAVVFSVLFSLFNHTLAMGAEPGDLVRLLPPVPVTNEIRKPETKSAAPETATESKTALPERTDHVQRMEEPPVSAPQTVSTVPSTVRARPFGEYVISGQNSDPSFAGGSRSGEGPGKTFAPNESRGNDGGDEIGPQAKNEIVPEPPKPNRPPEYIGVVNGKAIHLDIPEYPAVAKQMGVKGQVKVQVLIDADGSVVSATVAEGPKLLQRAAIASAKASKFSPTYLNNNKVSVRGIIVYNFK